MKRARILFLAALVMFSTLPLTSFATGQTEGSKVVEIAVWHRWFGAFGGIIADLLKEFDEKHPEIVIKETAVPGEYIELLQKMAASLAAGEEPPAVLIGGYALLNYVADELNPVIIDKANFGAEAEQILGSFYDATRELAVYKGKQVGLPFALSNPVTYYNGDLFKAAGLNPDKPPRTWQEVAVQARAIKKATGKAGVFIQNIDNWLDQALIFSNGGAFLTPDQRRVAFNGPEAVEAYEMWAGFVREGIHPKMTWKEAQASFTGGDIGMQMTTIGFLSRYREESRFDLRVTYLPTFGSKPLGVPCGGAALHILAKDKAKKAAAWELSKYLVSQEGMTKWVKTGYVAPIKAKVPVDLGQEISYEQLQNAKPWAWWPGGVVGLEIDRLFLDMRTKIIWGEIGVKEGLDKAVATCNALLK